jgi:hypothetical protein
VTVEGKENERIETAYSSPGTYRVGAEVASTDAGDANHRIQLWREDEEITGMATEVVVLEDGGISVVGYAGPGTSSPPPLPISD